MSLTITDIARSPGNSPMFRYPIRVQFSLPDPFVAQPTDGIFRPGEAIDVGADTAISARDGTFSLSLPWPSETDLPRGIYFLVCTITLPDGGTYTGIVPEGVSGPLLLHDLWNLYNWSSPAGPGKWAYPASEQILGMFMVDGPGIKHFPPIPYGEQHILGFLGI